MFRRAAEYFGEDGEATAAAKATEPERFFSKLLCFLVALKKAREDRLRVEHCLAADAAASPSGGAKSTGDSGGGVKSGEGEEECDGEGERERGGEGEA